MADQPYSKPPITEAVIQIHLADVLETDDLNKVNGSFSRLYPNHLDVQNLNFAVEMTSKIGDQPKTQVHHQETGHRRGIDDQTQVVVLWPTSLIISQLAPYPGWNDFFGRFDRDWTLWKRVVGYRKIHRVGVRYINRIDIPITDQVAYYEKYLNIYPSVPEQWGPNLAYGVQVQLPIADLGCILTINSSSVPAILLDHASFIFDQDIAKEANVPQNDKDLYKLLEDIHIKKNEIFESCITDEARELFR
jgi:uncharacterized protein (TIGR04255 family)